MTTEDWKYLFIAETGEAFLRPTISDEDLRDAKNGYVDIIDMQKRTRVYVSDDEPAWFDIPKRHVEADGK